MPSRRLTIRLLAFLAFAVLAAQAFPWRAVTPVFTSLSPLMSLLGAVAGRSVTWLTLLGLPVLVLGWFRSRWFCLHVCPVGLATDYLGRLNPSRRAAFGQWPHVGRWLTVVCIGGAAAGYPFFLWMDPLSLFNGFFSAWRAPLEATSLLTASGFIAALLMSVLWPQSWCHRVCPLGALQDLLTIARRQMEIRRTPPLSPPLVGVSRRLFLSAAAGGLSALAFRRWAVANPLPIRPPGARPEDTFTGLCARCGNCVRSCPYHILHPDLGSSGPAGLLTPVMSLAQAHCFEYCNECTKVCPTGALRRLSLETKRNLAIGLAHVDRDRCIAWHDRQYCMVCHEFCPYSAIEPVEQNGVNCPAVKPGMCRGCGACEVNCPALPRKAILVHGIPQRPATPLLTSFDVTTS